MGAWSGEPFGNDVATDWAWELEDAADWSVVRSALDEAVTPPPPVEQDTAVVALAAAEVVAHALGRATQDDAYTGDVDAFVARVDPPDAELVTVALTAVYRAGDPEGPLGRTWAEDGNDSWHEAVERLSGALRG